MFIDLTNSVSSNCLSTKIICYKNHIQSPNLRVNASYECASSNLLVEKMIGHGFHTCSECGFDEFFGNPVNYAFLEASCYVESTTVFK